MSVLIRHPISANALDTKLCLSLRLALQHASREIKDAIKSSDQQQASSAIARQLESTTPFEWSPVARLVLETHTPCLTPSVDMQSAPRLKPLDYLGKQVAPKLPISACIDGSSHSATMYTCMYIAHTQFGRNVSSLDPTNSPDSPAEWRVLNEICVFLLSPSRKHSYAAVAHRSGKPHQTRQCCHRPLHPVSCAPSGAAISFAA